MPAIRVGLIGLGSMGRHHARIIRETPGMDLVAVADPHGDRFGAVRSLNVLRDVEELVCGGVAAAGYVERYNPALVELRRQLAEGKLGEVFQIATSRQGAFPVRVSDVGVVKDLAAHDIDLTSWLGQSAYASVFAHVSRRSGGSHEDVAAVTGRLINGIIVNHLVHWLSPRKVRQTLVIGERGALVADTAAGDLTFYANGAVHDQWDGMPASGGTRAGVHRYPLARHQPLRIEYENFRNALIGRPNSCVTLEEGVQTLVVLEA